MMESLSGVVIDQLVIVENSSNEMVGKVLRFTPKGFIVVGVGKKQEYTFHQNGTERSADPWQRWSCRPMTAEDRTRIVLTNRRNEVKRAIEASWKALTTEECQAIMEILDGAKKEGGAE